MKRFFAVLSVLCLCAGLFAACGGSSASYNVADVASAVESVCNIENPKEIEQDDLIYTMNLAEEDFVEFAGQQTLTNGKPGTVRVVKAAEGKADTVKTQLEAYRDGIVATWENYKDDFPIGYEQTQNGRVVVKGDYVVLAIAGEGVDYSAVDTAIDEALK